MQTSYYIFDDEGAVIAIFKDEEFARDYLYHLGITEDYCKIGILNDNVFIFEEHDAKYHMQQSSLNTYMHQDCKRFKRISEEIGYCFLTDENVVPYGDACNAIEVKK